MLFHLACCLDYLKRTDVNASWLTVAEIAFDCSLANWIESYASIGASLSTSTAARAEFFVHHVQLRLFFFLYSRHGTRVDAWVFVAVNAH